MPLSTQLDESPVSKPPLETDILFIFIARGIKPVFSTPVSIILIFRLLSNPLGSAFCFQPLMCLSLKSITLVPHCFFARRSISCAHSSVRHRRPLTSQSTPLPSSTWLTPALLLSLSAASLCNVTISHLQSSLRSHSRPSIINSINAGSRQ